MSAGDAYFVISSMMLYLSKSLQISSFTGNLAGAITVGVAGCVPIDKSKFFQSINTHFKIWWYKYKSINKKHLNIKLC